MKAMAAAGLAAGLLGLILAIAALTAMPEGPGDLKARTDGLSRDLARAMDRLGETASRLDAAESALAGLRSKAEGLSSEVSRLDGAVAAAGKSLEALAGRREAAPGAAPAAGEGGQAPDEARLRDMVRGILRDETQALFARMGAARGGQQQDAAFFVDRLGVDAAKAEKVAQVRSKLGDETRKIWTDNRGGGPQQNQQLIREAQSKAEEEVANLLSPDEMVKYRALQLDQQRFGRGGPGGGGRGGPGGGGRGGQGQPAAPAPGPPQENF